MNFLKIIALSGAGSACLAKSADPMQRLLSKCRRRRRLPDDTDPNANTATGVLNYLKMQMRCPEERKRFEAHMPSRPSVLQKYEQGHDTQELQQVSTARTYPTVPGESDDLDPDALEGLHDAQTGPSEELTFLESSPQQAEPEAEAPESDDLPVEAMTQDPIPQHAKTEDLSSKEKLHAKQLQANNQHLEENAESFGIAGFGDGYFFEWLVIIIPGVGVIALIAEGLKQMGQPARFLKANAESYFSMGVIGFLSFLFILFGQQIRMNTIATLSLCGTLLISSSLVSVGNCLRHLGNGEHTFNIENGFQLIEDANLQNASKWLFGIGGCILSICAILIVILVLVSSVDYFKKRADLKNGCFWKLFF